MGRSLLILVPLLAILGLSLWWMTSTWQAAADAPFAGGDYVPLVLGVILSVVIGCGLMALLFISSRRGYDEAAQTQVLPRPPSPEVPPPVRDENAPRAGGATRTNESP
ncbi:hypothetical protein DFO45_4933 [Azorhizobium sp. AG788]|uniref:hypothetical protein n=1 Tax=Azorhizobium sp. AG788 TaxID=2183897 RepID=UPI0010DE479D|nr:hypothetical protein [Azorhizobium sp. AG788]TDT87716.1 hypothetical protein DFO45_4933 [Azorhizobium sp. AG788]